MLGALGTRIAAAAKSENVRRNGHRPPKVSGGDFRGHNPCPQQATPRVPTPRQAYTAHRRRSGALPLACRNLLFPLSPARGGDWARLNSRYCLVGERTTEQMPIDFISHQNADASVCPSIAGIPHLRNFAMNTSSLLLPAGSSIALTQSVCGSSRPVVAALRGSFGPTYVCMLRLRYSPMRAPVTPTASGTGRAHPPAVTRHGEHLQSDAFNKRFSLRIISRWCTCCSSRKSSFWCVVYRLGVQSPKKPLANLHRLDSIPLRVVYRQVSTYLVLSRRDVCAHHNNRLAHSNVPVQCVGQRPVTCSCRTRPHYFHISIFHFGTTRTAQPL